VLNYVSPLVRVIVNSFAEDQMQAAIDDSSMLERSFFKKNYLQRWRLRQRFLEEERKLLKKRSMISSLVQILVQCYASSEMEVIKQYFAQKRRDPGVNVRKRLEKLYGKVTLCHASSLSEPNVVHKIKSKLDPGVLDRLCCRIIYFDTEVDSRADNTAHENTCLFCFFDSYNRSWLFIRKILDGYYIKENENDVIRCSKSDTVELIDKFIDDGTLCYFSQNGCDQTRLEGLYRSVRKPVPKRWLDAGRELVFKMFGPKNKPIYSPNMALSVVYEFFWDVKGRRGAHVAYCTDQQLKKSFPLFRDIDWSVPLFEKMQRKPWKDCMMLFDIVESLGRVLGFR
jgi:hypothetical protein